MDNSQAHEIFIASELYRDAAYVLNQRANQPRIDPGTAIALMHVVIANTAFALEHALKCLYFLENEKKNWGHDLKQLFLELSIDKQEKLTTYFTDFRHAKAERYRMAGVEREPEMDLMKELEAGGNAFFNYRYPDELKAGERDFHLGDLHRAARKLIRELRPEWKVLYADETNVLYPDAKFIKG